MAMPSAAHVALLTIELLIPCSGSLKNKRRVIRSIKDRIAARFNVSVAEIGYLEEWQRAQLGIAMIANDRQYVERCLGAAGRLVEETLDIQMLRIEMEWL